MKKLICLILAVCMMATVLGGCAGDTNTNAGNTNTNTNTGDNTNTNTGDTTKPNIGEIVTDGGVTAGGTEVTGTSENNNRPLIAWFWMDPTSTNPYGAMMDNDFWNWAMVGGVPVYLMPDGTYSPGFFTDWSSNDEQSEWTITIHPDAKWSDGEDLNVDDVIFSQKYFLTDRSRFDANIRYAWSTSFNFNIEKISDKQFKCVSVDGTPMPNFMGQWAMPYCEVLPEHIWKDVEPEVFLTCDQAKNPIGAGPYLLKEYVPGESITYTANPLFYGDAPAIQEIKFLIIVDMTAATLAIEDGTLDYHLMLSPADYVRITALDGMEGFISHKNTARAFRFNLSTVSKEVRIACNYMVDKELWNNQFYGGTGDIMYGAIARGVKYQSDEGLTYYEYNIEKGQQVLEDAGYTMGADGFYEKDGETLELDCLYTTGSQDAIALFAQQQLQAGGIKVNLKGLTSTEKNAAQRAGEYDFYWGGGALSADAAAWSAFKHYSSWNENPNYQMDKWEAAAATTDEAEKARIYHEIDVELNQDAVWIFGIQEHSIIAKKAGLDFSEAIVSQQYGFVHWEKLHWD